MSEQKLSFQAEVSRLLDIVANALYSNQEIFLRELISNASDACDKLRYLLQTNADLASEVSDFAIQLSVDKEARQLIISDNGIGMSRDELIENLGTIARSGTGAFLNSLENRKDGTNLIGQFGVGFYSSFMVADHVAVLSRRAGETQAYSWQSDGKGEFTLAEAIRENCGTTITLTLKEESGEYLETYRLETIVKTYSDHISIPIQLWRDPLPASEGDEETPPQPREGHWETINAASAIWTRPKSEVTEEQYKEFYHHVAHAFDEPWLREHFHVEGNQEYRGLLYIPGSKPHDLFQPERKHRVKLYVRRVFITEGAEELLPPYLRFLRGVVDSEDLPLNVSREMLQDNPVLRKIRGGLVKRILSTLRRKADKDYDSYLRFWENFGAVLKEGLYEDFSQRDTLLELLRLRSLNNGDSWISLKDYLDSMKEGQEKIYYIAGEDIDVLRRSPQVEGFKSKAVDVLLLNDPVDEFWLSTVHQFEGKSFQSVTRGCADLDKIKGKDQAEKEEQKEEQGKDVASLLALLKLTLKDDVKDVRTTDRLTESAVCLVADTSDMDMHMERILRNHKHLSSTAKRILEINPKHILIQQLSCEASQEGAADNLESAAYMLLDQARILEGEAPKDAALFAQRLSDVMTRALGSDSRLFKKPAEA